MTDPIDFLADSDDGQHSITITPVLITPTTGVLYTTGEYALSEGEVGMGTITFDTNNDWSFEGITDIGEEVIQQIAAFIKKIDHTPAGFTEDEETDTSRTSEGVVQGPSNTLNFIINDNGMPVDVRVEMNYPFYDVTVGGTITAQLQQDHHSNWFVTNGHLNDNLVQAIGVRITAEVVG